MEVPFFTAVSTPECENFLTIQWPGEPFRTIDKFIECHPQATKEEIDDCMVNYRGTEKRYGDYTADYSKHSNAMRFVQFKPLGIVIDQTIRASHYFLKKTIECCQTGRFFTLKSIRILDSDFNLRWKYGYIPQFFYRCRYFGTAATWYSNTFDQLLQVVYWAFSLYESAEDRKGNPYNNTWDVKKIMSRCTYDFVVGALKAKDLIDVRNQLISCYAKIEEVRMWANYIKHKGGIDYKYLEADDPLHLYLVPVEEENDEAFTKFPDERFEIKNFKSPIEIDIDEKLPVLENAYQVLYECINSIKDSVKYEDYILNFGGKKNG